jgi:5'-phosphate synthase pdxT subunit
MMAAPVGLLALQGDFEKHRQALARVGALVIPGGESTTLSRLIDRGGLRAPLLEFAAAGHPVLGTCAGLIMLSRGLVGERDDTWHGVRPLGLLDVTVRRNGYGRQVDSFSEELVLNDGLAPADELAAQPFRAVYIRAPRIETVGPGTAVIARRPDGEIVGVRQGNLVGLTFHPELAGDGRFHRLLTVLRVDRSTAAPGPARP